MPSLDLLFHSGITFIFFLFRIMIPLISILIVIKCALSLKRGRRREDPVVLLYNRTTHQSIPVLYWENSLGRSRSCDIVLHDPTVSRSHAVLMRRESGWLITDTGSKSGTYLNGTKLKAPKQILPGDSIAIGSTVLQFRRVADPTQSRSVRRVHRAPSPFRLLVAVTLVQLLLCVQSAFVGGTFHLEPWIPMGVLFVLEWALYAFALKGLGHVSFELETVGFLLSGIGIMLLSGVGGKTVYVQTGALALGVVLFCVMIWFLGDLDRVMRFRLAIGGLAVLLFAANLVLARSTNGARNWISIGGISIQPSEFIKIAFVFVGASTLDRLQTAKNLTGFIAFSAACMGALFLMRDFGTASIFFVAFLIIAFMRSGSVRTIALACAVAVFGAFLILKIKPYIAQRFESWRHVWENVNNSGGYQQTRVMTYTASGGCFGTGIGNGKLKDVFASTSDLVFGMLCEELGLVLAIVVVISIALLMFFARSDVTRSRSTFYSISACAAAGMMLFQASLNVFGATDVLPLTGVTLPFISAGGSSMVAVWGLLAFIKASDERTYAARRKSR
ncbi:FtsW/RodA/SpoVE family cell cycle protein [Caproiciproducens sp. LBM24188]